MSSHASRPVADPQATASSLAAAPDPDALPPAAPTRLVLFAPDFTEVSTIARVRGFRDAGFEVTVLAFRRGRYNPGFAAPWPEVELGTTTDGHYLRRAAKLLAALPALWRERRLLRQADALYARNLDQLLLARLAQQALGAHGRLVYEVLDVAPLLTRPGLAGAAARLLERLLLRHIALLVVSSPAFHRHHLAAAQGYRGPAFLLENRLHPAAAATIRAAARAGAAAPLEAGRWRWRVGYFGLIRGQATFDLMLRLARRLPDVQFRLHGILTTVDAKAFAQAVAAQDNLVYGGAYVNPDDLARLYGAVDLAWALDLEHARHNSRWLLPCRYYEAGLLGVPLLAARGFEVGNRVEALGIGWTVDAPYEGALARLLAGLDRLAYETVRRRLAALPEAEFVAGDDVRELGRTLAEGGTPTHRFRLDAASGGAASRRT